MSQSFPRRVYTGRELAYWMMSSHLQVGDPVAIDYYHEHERAVRKLMQDKRLPEEEARVEALKKTPLSKTAILASRTFDRLILDDGSVWLFPQCTRAKTHLNAATKQHPKDAQLFPVDHDLDAGREARRLADQLDLIAKSLRKGDIDISHVGAHVAATAAELDLLRLGAKQK